MAQRDQSCFLSWLTVLIILLFVFIPFAYDFVGPPTRGWVYFLSLSMSDSALWLAQGMPEDTGDCLVGTGPCKWQFVVEEGWTHFSSFSDLPFLLKLICGFFLSWRWSSHNMKLATLKWTSQGQKSDLQPTFQWHFYCFKWGLPPGSPFLKSLW